ncbi:hypothetical protein SAMN05216579_5483 [Pseudomonas granadensis]|nr:hypothetical protein SAMN05216579_5483 [Pseudomonas granadensis]
MELHHEFEDSQFFHRSRIDRRAADALVGLAAGITADGIVNIAEAVFLKQWLEDNLAHLNDPVINLLYSRLACILQDNALDVDESRELLDILRSFSGVRIERPKENRVRLRFSIFNWKRGLTPYSLRGTSPQPNSPQSKPALPARSLEQTDL